MLLWHSQLVRPPPGPITGDTPQASASRAPDADTAAVGDTTPTEPRAPTSLAKENKPLAQEPLPEPRPGQAQPDKKGRCLGSQQVPINGGCWVDVSSSMGAQVRAENGYVLFKGQCFDPVLAPPQKPQPTSRPQEKR